MYVLWRNKPHAVLGMNDEWIPKGEIPHRLDQVRFFQDAGEARYVQRSKYSKCGVSVLNQKSFKEKAHVKKLPVFKAGSKSAGAEGEDGSNAGSSQMQAQDKPCIYGEYLEKLCEGSSGYRSRVVFPPSNLRYTTETPILAEACSMLSDILKHIAVLEDRESQLRDEIKRLDLLNSDRLHQVEMYELSDEECVTFVRAMHESQLERRRRKNELAAVLAEKEILQQLNRDELRQAIKTIKGLGQQEYHCRVLAESDSIVVNHNKKAQ